MAVRGRGVGFLLGNNMLILSSKFLLPNKKIQNQVFKQKVKIIKRHEAHRIIKRIENSA